QIRLGGSAEEYPRRSWRPCLEVRERPHPRPSSPRPSSPDPLHPLTGRRGRTARTPQPGPLARGGGWGGRERGRGEGLGRGNCRGGEVSPPPAHPGRYRAQKITLPLRRLADQALVIVDLHRPDRLHPVVAPVGPDREEGPRD